MQSWVILLNWNGWKDTIECLESVLRLDCPGVGVVVCDNASSDGSWEKMLGWARGEIVARPGSPQLAHLLSPPVPKPVLFREITRAQVGSSIPAREDRLVFFQNGANLGFAGGNNVGLRYALRDPDARYFWILNNDTVVEPWALSAMIRLMKDQPRIGLSGSLNLDYANPKMVQAQGGFGYSRWTGRSRKPPTCSIDELGAHPPRLDYINGASMLASRDFLERVGLLEESYFLYYEETDWAMRARGKFALGYACDSVIYHKLGTTLGSSADRGKRSLTAERYAARNRVLFTRRFAPYALPTVLLSGVLAAFHRLSRGDIARFKTILAWTWKGLREPLNRNRTNRLPAEPGCTSRGSAGDGTNKSLDFGLDP